MDEKLKELHITAAALARYYGVNVRTVWNWRHGKCPAHVTRHLDILISYQAALDAVRNA